MKEVVNFSKNMNELQDNFLFFISLCNHVSNIQIYVRNYDLKIFYNHYNFHIIAALYESLKKLVSA